MKKIVIHIKSPDQKGIVSAYADMLASMQINILNLEQHVEPDDSLFFMRILAESDNILSISSLKEALDVLDQRFNASSLIYDTDKKLNLAILVTHESLPLYDILIKHKTSDIKSDLKVVISNHDTLSSIADQFNVQFKFIDVNTDKEQGNNQLKNILDKNSIDLVVLARYMQIIPKDIVEKYKGRMINIHHGFLPAFKGAHPYRQAWERGVKIIGASAHYVTEHLDEGPIISQDVVPVTHHHSIDEMIDSGRNLERNVLVDAIKAHLEYRVIIHGKRTIIFNK
tara:strand:- start:32 stop:880 length:849 start_codon:yes stop_codon:yes gene_type:complete